jgi:hypothetical protein
VFDQDFNKKFTKGHNVELGIFNKKESKMKNNLNHNEPLPISNLKHPFKRFVGVYFHL